MSQSNSDDAFQEQLSQLPDQQSLVAVFVSQTGPVATVDQGGVRLLVKAATTPMMPGDSVRLERRNGELTVIGPTRARSTTGRVAATGSLTTVEYPDGSGVTAQLRRNSAYTPAVNDTVLIDWSSGGVIVGKLDATPTTVTPPPPPPAGTVRYDQVFTAIDSGAFQSPYGWRTNDVWSSASNIGAWFYGSKIRDTIPDGAKILAAEIYLPLQQQLGAAPFGRHGAESKPGGALSFAAVSTLSGKSGWVPIPTSLIDHLKANAGGLGFDYGGYNVWRGVQKDGQSGAVHIIYEA